MKEIDIGGLKCEIEQTETGYKVVIAEPDLEPTVVSRNCPTEKLALELAQLWLESRYGPPPYACS
jgi:hypothetical protein